MGTELYPNEKLKKYCEHLKQKIPLNKEILLIKGPQINLNAFELEVAKNRCYYAYPPTGLQCLAAAMRKHGLKIKILDLNFELLKRIKNEESFDYKNWISILDDYLEKNNPSIIGVSNTFAVDVPSLIEILNYLKGKNKLILAGGHNATYDGERLLNEGLCHFVFQKESENKIKFFMDNLYENKGNPAMSGILFKYGTEIIQTTGNSCPVKLEGNLIEEHKLVPIEEYCKVGTLSPYSRISGKDKTFAMIGFNRGCEGGCKFCGVRDYMGIGVRSREIKDFLNEMEYLHKERGVKHFEISDDDFARYHDKSMEVLQGIIDKKLNITWASNNGLIVRTLSDDLLEKMRDSGCIGFKVGIESGNEEMLREVRKPGTLEIFREFSKNIRKYPEMFVVDYYIVGFPNETFGKMIETLKFSIEMDLDWSGFSVYQPNVNYFGDEEERERKKDNDIGDFIPTKDLEKGKLNSSEEFSGLNIFKMPHDKVPSKTELGEIWFTFNFLRNFIFNKNLEFGWKRDKFLSWVEAIEERYPTHPYMNFALALVHCLRGDVIKAEIQYEKMIKNLNDDYWKEKFDDFELTEVLKKFPKTVKDAEETLIFLRKKYEMRING
ncbi:B12-binding domain-containing radical SAM protein [archaeon]|jgi:radical SAM superfamily enzyme YgiQ (UPF0313 family)|nr:B12-binding domain-containing radical SAM protein [archaeon]